MTMSEFIAAIQPQIQALIVAVVGFMIVFLGQWGTQIRDKRITAKKEAQQKLEAKAQNLKSDVEEKALFMRMINDTLDRTKSLESAREKDQARIDELEKQFSEAVERANEQADALTVAKSQNDELARQMAQLQLEVNSLKSQREALNKELREEKARRTEAEEARTQLAVQLAQERENFQQEVNSLRTKLEHLEAELNSMKPTVEKLETGEHPEAKP